MIPLNKCFTAVRRCDGLSLKMDIGAVKSNLLKFEKIFIIFQKFWSMVHGAWSMEHGAWSMEHER